VLYDSKKFLRIKNVLLLFAFTDLQCIVCCFVLR